MSPEAALRTYPSVMVITAPVIIELPMCTVQVPNSQCQLFVDSCIIASEIHILTNIVYPLQQYKEQVVVAEHGNVEIISRTVKEFLIRRFLGELHCLIQSLEVGG